MTISAYAIGCDQPVAAAKELMQRHRIRHLPVMQGGTVVGLLSQRDIAFLERVDSTTTENMIVERAMTPDPYIVSPDAPLDKVARHMAKHKIGSALVVEDSRLIGIFTSNDALRVLAEFVSGTQ